MILLLDTSAISSFGRGEEKRLIEVFSSRHELLVPLIVIGELRAGFAHGTKQKQNEDLLQKFLDTPNVSTITLSDITTLHYAAIYQKLKITGKPINTNDMWIAALTLEYDCTLVTLDSDFKRIANLSIAKL